MDSIKGFYTGIDDLPVWNWYQVNEKGDFSFLARTNKAFQKASRGVIENLWMRIYDEFLAKFGWGEVFNQILRKRIEVAKLKIEMAVTGDKTLLTLIKILMIEIDELMMPLGKPIDFYVIKTALEKHNGFRIDPRKTTVIEFYTYVKEMTKK
mgnify:CR=1 FL=1